MVIYHSHGNLLAVLDGYQAAFVAQSHQARSSMQRGGVRKGNLDWVLMGGIAFGAEE